jgi:hypothetical protein
MIHNKKNRYLPEEKYQIGICIEDSLSLLWGRRWMYKCYVPQFRASKSESCTRNLM